MFSFLKTSFKKLLNFQKTDTNSVEKDKQVELESNDGNTRLFEDIKIKDTDLNNERYESNKNYQRGELTLTKFRSTFSSFHSNETASTSLESNLHASFDNPINIIYKSQRQSSKLAAKKITKIADRLSMQSDEEMSDEGDAVIEKSSEETKLIKKSNKRNLNRKTIRFCQKCKTHKIFVGDVTRRKYCDMCKSILFYICSNCKEKLYASHKGWRVHESICNRQNTILKLVNVRNESILHQYSNYNSNEKSDLTAGHSKEQDLVDTKDKRKLEARSEKVHNKKAVTSNKQIKMKSLTKWIRRYCQTCQKTMKLLGILKMKNKTKCKTCSTQLQFLCVKCHDKFNSKTDINHHFQSKCLPTNYKCSKCNFHSTNAKSLSLHLKIQHPVILQCDMCTYQSQFKTNLIRHICAIHLQKRFSCEICSFTTTYLQTLRRHELSSHSSK